LAVAAYLPAPKRLMIDAGRPTGSSLARFGRNATIEAQAIVDKTASALINAETQRASGVALSAGYADKLVQIEGGTTPVGLGNTRATWRVAVTPQVSKHARPAHGLNASPSPTASFPMPGRAIR
jgi:hypothetical protein